MVGYYPETLKDALLLRKELPDTTLYAGGTDLMTTRNFHENLIFLNRIPEMGEIRNDKENYYFGSGCTFDRMAEAEELPPIIRKVFLETASPAIRNRGTLGGNICNASPVGDSLPMWYALRASVKLELANGADHFAERTVPVRDFILSLRQTDLADDEILTQIIVPREALNHQDFYYHEKVAARRAEAISKLSFFGLVKIQDGKIKSIGTGFGAVGLTVVKKEDSERRLVGLDREAVKRIKQSFIEEYMESVKPITDQRSTMEYRKRVAENLLTDFTDRLIERL